MVATGWVVLSIGKDDDSDDDNDDSGGSIGGVLSEADVMGLGSGRRDHDSKPSALSSSMAETLNETSGLGTPSMGGEWMGLDLFVALGQVSSNRKRLVAPDELATLL